MSVDPAARLPPAVFDKILQRLDSDSLLTAKAVNREWLQRANENAHTRDDVPVRPSPAELSSLHDASFIVFALRCWHASVFRWALVADYVSTHGEVGMSRVMRAFQLLGASLLMSFPLAFVAFSGSFSVALFVIAVIECALTFAPLPSHVSSESFSTGLIVVHSVLTLGWAVKTDVLALRHALSQLPSPFVAVPLIVCISVVSLVWELFVARLFGATASAAKRGTDYSNASRLLVFQPARCVRHVGWVLSVASRSSWPVLIVSSLAHVALPGFVSHRMGLINARSLPGQIVFVFIASSVAAVLTNVVSFWSFALDHFVRTFVVAFSVYLGAATLRGSWFRGPLLLGARTFHHLLYGTIIIVVFSSIVLIVF